MVLQRKGLKIFYNKLFQNQKLIFRNQSNAQTKSMLAWRKILKKRRFGLRIKHKQIMRQARKKLLRKLNRPFELL